MDKELEKLIYSPHTTGKDINEYFYKIDKEELFLSIIKDYVIKEYKGEYSNYIFYLNPDDEALFELNRENSALWCDSDLVWRVFMNTYGMDYQEIQSFINEMAEKHFKLKGVTSKIMIIPHYSLVKKGFK